MADARQRDFRHRQPDETVWRLRRRAGFDRGAGLDHRVLHRHTIRPGSTYRAGVHHRPWHQHHRRAGRVDALNRLAGAVCVPCNLDLPRPGRPVWHRDCCDLHAQHGRHCGGSGRLRTDHRQRRRHCRNGRATGQCARNHRSARRRGQHHQGCHQRLRHWLGGSGRAGFVCRLHPQAGELRPGHQL